MASWEFKKMRVGIFGLGVTGKSLARFLESKVQKLCLFDQNRPSQEFADKFYPLEAERPELDLLLISPGIDPSHPLITYYQEKGVEISGEIELAARISKKPILAFTGTNGKTTTVSLLADALEKGGLRVGLGGNIGTPFIDLVAKEDKFDLYLLELSSFQLETCEKFSTLISGLLNCEPSHMERYQSFEEYLGAKLRIFSKIKENGLALIDEKWQKSLDLTVNSQLIPEHVKELEKELSRYLNLSHLNLKGPHNLRNIFVAHAVINFLERDFSLNKDAAYLAIQEFQPLEHRLERVAFFNELDVYNDSKSTNLDSTLSAVKAIEKEKNLTLIMGGKVRGEDPLDEKKLEEIFRPCQKVYLYGEAKSLFKESEKLSFLNSFEEIQELGRMLRGVLLFSPGFPSFDLFKNYIERGEAFKKLIFSLELKK